MKASKDAEIARLRAELAAATAPKPPSPLSMKVADKGGLSIYGLGRFPVTLYKEQWARLLAAGPQITNFITANDGALKAKA